MLEAIQTHITPTARRASVRKGSIFVATNLRGVDRDTAELGEDYDELRQIEVAFRLFMRRLNRGLRRCNSTDARDSIKELILLAPDARFDASFGSLLSRARDAFGDARVVRMVRPQARA